MKRITLLASILCVSMSACSKEASMTNLTLSHEMEFGQISFNTPIETFNSKGFSFGDSVTISFSNGEVVEDVPYFDGYYTKPGETLLVGYPGYDSIRLAINNGPDIYEKLNIDNSTMASIKLARKGKYLDIENTLSMVYSNDRNEFASDEVFANFREVTVGNIKDNILFRSASPCDNQYSRATYVSKLCEKHNINYFLDLADTSEKLEKYNSDTYDISYWKNKYASGDVVPLALNMSYSSDTFMNGVKTMFTSFLNNDGPFLFHCTEGKDRTGFVAVLFESLAGASIEEIRSDYMITYDNYYGINEASNKKKYDTIVEYKFEPMIKYLTGKLIKDTNKDELLNGVQTYISSCGISNEDIALVKSKLNK